jgi:murein DD-endopeptidase MepM/ murein hydrolase activator NlpD
MAGRHTPAVAGAPQAPRQKRRSGSFRKFLVSAGATLVAFSIAAAMAIPAEASISTTASVTPSLSIGQQKMSVSQKAVLQTVTRDSFSIGHQYKDGGPAIGSVNGWAAPTTLRINSPWGPRPVICTSGVGCDSGFHQGDDFAGACGTPFYAASGGTVTSITYGGLAGDEIVIDYGQYGI